jgi:hypothetical protein
MFFRYARSDVRLGGRTRHLARTAAWVAMLAGLARGGWGVRLRLLAAGVAYIGLPVQRARRDRIPARDWWRIPFAAALKDLAQIAGAAVGTVDELRTVASPLKPADPPQSRTSVRSFEAAR